ncbi:Putative membrane localized peptidase [Zea mays]|uniref:Aminopeptidase NAALADL1 n=1 Tax=Zea mays TaxID=4577 RepID=A0A1D6L708_MAIZE|nr:Putative membrane localized peptidase [Zea mays]
MPHSVLARLPPGSVRLVAAFGLLLLVSLLVLHRRPGRPHVAAAAASDRLTDPSRSRLFLSQSPGANASIAADLRALTAGPHLAGTPASAGAAAHVLARLRAAGLQTLTREYEPLLSYPGHASLALLRPDGSLLARLSLEEPADEGRRVVPPYHAYAPSGGAVAEAVFVNLGREEDYVVLERLGVGVRGRVAVARRGGGYRGGVVARAADKGAVAVLIAGNADGGVERGVVLLGGPGDPLTPGWAATSGAERLKFDDKAVKQRFPSIPSMPVSAKTAAAIIRSLGGPAIPAEWKDGLGVDTGGLGPGPTLVNFTYQEDRKFYKIRDIFGIIKGQEEPDRYVILGNHRDAWTYGAVDPNSGTAALLDIARRLGIMLQSGWKPRRSIILCSWDGEEFGMIGSTEWVEDNLEDLHSKAVAYLNVDCAVQGVGFFAGSTPQLDKLLVDITRQVRDPDVTGKMVHDTWNEMSGGIKVRIEFFLKFRSAYNFLVTILLLTLIIGWKSMAIHSFFVIWLECLYSFSASSVTEIWGLLALRLANDPVLPFDYQAYTSQLQEHIKTLSALTSNGHAVNLMNGCVNDLSGAAMEVLKEMKKLQQMDLYDEHARMRRRLLNDRLLLAERSFLQPEGLQGRGWFKHLLYSPPEDYESKLSFFPGIADAISRSANLSDKEQEVAMQHEVWKVCRAIQRAASVLRGEFSEQKPTNFSSLVTP